MNSNACSSRFGKESLKNIENVVINNIPINTVKTKRSVWEQFSQFCSERHFKLEQSTTPEEISNILEDYGFNMKKQNGEDYKESSIKSIWNTTAQMIQEKYFKEFGIKIDPFTDIRFKAARLAKDTKRKLLQGSQEKRKLSAKAFSTEELLAMVNSYNEEEPDGLQKKFFHLCSFELAWRGNEAAYCKICYFQKELDMKGEFTGRIEYNAIFSKTTQGGAKALADSKWLIKNNVNESLCPVRLFLKLMNKRGTNITTDRLFLTIHPNWQKGIWYKNIPLGINTLSKWTKLSAARIGLETKKFKVTNHSHRSSAISALAKKGVGEQQMIKITGHSSVHSIKPYLQLDSEHHKNLVQNLRENAESVTPLASPPISLQNHQTSLTSVEKNHGQTINNYNNCIFNIVNNK